MQQGLKKVDKISLTIFDKLSEGNTLIFIKLHFSVINDTLYEQSLSKLFYP